MKRILVIDDEPTISETLRDILTGEGYEVDTAANGAEGLARIHEARPDLVLLDVMMPVLDGFGVLERLAQQSQSRPPVVLMSAGSVPAEWKRRVNRFLPKPFDLESLLAAVGELIDGPSG